MSLAPLLNAPAVIQFHAAAAMLALGVGAAQLWRPKGTRSHRVMGWSWVIFMMAIAVSSFWISTIKQFGAFSLIHVLSIVTIINVPLAVYAARRGRISAHKSGMVSIFFLALVVAGLFTLLPGRILGRVLWGS